MFFMKSGMLFSIIILHLFSIFLCVNDTSFLIIQFKGKSLQEEEQIDEDSEPMWEIDSDYPYIPKVEVYNSSTFINEWFYNGMFTFSSIGSTIIESYINMENSKLSIEKCNLNRVYSKSSISQEIYYKPLKSDSYTKKNDQIGNDIFTFPENFALTKLVKIGETKGNGLDFYFNENDNGKALCGNFGLNMNTNSDKTNLILQLKKKKYINKYIWTLKYQNVYDGIIIVGNEPHFYDSSYYMSQYCKMKAIPTQSSETAWSFKMSEVRTYDKNNNKIVLSKNKVDFLIDRGLIIGTDEYKKKIDELVFNDLIEKKICFREIKSFDDKEKGTNDEYFIYYCSLNSFKGNQYTIEKTYYNTFPSLEFYDRESNMTFSLNKDFLFHEKFSRIYFLVVFKKSENENNIWKLGEPFFCHFQFTFDQEQKTVGFYNTKLEKIPNDEYMKSLNENQSKFQIKYLILIIGLIILVGILVGLAYFFGKKFNESRKKRANELNDDDFDYSSNTKMNNTNNDTKRDYLPIN